MKKLMYISIMAIVAGFGCKKGFLSELQNNPNNPTTNAATVQLVLPGTINNLVSQISGTGTNNYQLQAAWVGYWNYSGGYTFNTGAHEYIITNTGPVVWDAYYGILTNLNVIKQTAGADASLSNYNDIADILEAVCYKNLVDAYNDVPYSKALKGAGNFYPTYDKGSDIYDSLVAKLDVAMADISANISNAAKHTPGADDIMFQGDMTQWLKFANTEKLKLLVQQSAVSSKQAYITSEASKTNSYGYTTQDALVNPGYSGTQQGALYGTFGISATGGINGGYTYIRAGGFALNFYKTTNDPRLGYFYSAKGSDPTTASYYVPTGNQSDYNADYLGTQSLALTQSSGIGPGLITKAGASQPSVMMLAAESYFVQAEAAVRGYITADAKSLYQSGITASFEYLGVDDADNAAQAYYSQSAITNVSWPANAADQISTIITQKWAALNGISNMEAWNDWRRTGFPAVPATKDPNSIEKHMPYRLYYPIEEPNTNNAAYLAAGGDKIDPFVNKIFWMP